MKTALILGALLVTAGPTAEANHIRGHYGGVPMVQPAPLPWRHAPVYQRPPIIVVPPPAPYYGAPQQQPPPLYVPVPQHQPPQAGRYKGLNICQTMRCD